MGSMVNDCYVIRVVLKVKDVVHLCPSSIVTVVSIFNLRQSETGNVKLCCDTRNVRPIDNTQGHTHCGNYIW